MRRRGPRPLWIALAAVLALGQSCAPLRPPAGTFLDRAVEVDGKIYRFRVYLPPGHAKTAGEEKKRRFWKCTWPVLLFLHGSGERGGNNRRQTESGLGPALRAHPERYPFVVVFPQCPAGATWEGETERVALAALDQSLKEYDGNPRRVTVTGLSMGGTGAWHFAALHRERFAAAVPICGEIVPTGGDPIPAGLLDALTSADPYAGLAAGLGDLPVWAFHGSLDSEIPVEESRRMTAALHSRGGRVRYSELSGLGHNAWDAAYDEPELPRWILAQRRR